MENMLSLENDISGVSNTYPNNTQNALHFGSVIELNNSLTNEKIKNAQTNFLESTLGKVINSGIDIVIKSLLPDLIEKQVIDVKNTILEQGFFEGVKEAINSSIDLGKSAIGIVTGNFENIYQVERAVEKGGILDTTSKLLDTAITKAKKEGLINKEISTIIKQSKNTVVETLRSKIGESFKEQVKYIEKLNHYCETWNTHYQNEDFTKMEYSYKNMEKYLELVMPMENTINEARKIENLHNLIKNNCKKFDITENHEKLAEKLAEV